MNLQPALPITAPIRITVVTVCYNAASTIEVTLRSMATQTYPHVEYLIVDGASSDGTLDVVQRYATHISRIVSEKDEGIYDAMNKGIGLATGDVIYFLNADDSFVDDTVLADIAAVFEEDASRMLVYGNVVYQDAPDGIVYGPAVPFRDGSIHEILHKPFCHQATFARLALFEKTGTFDRSFRYVADYEWYIKAFKADPKSLYQVDRNIANYFYQGRSYTQGEKTRKEKATVFFRHLMSFDMLWYWLRYMKLRGWKKKLFGEQW